MSYCRITGKSRGLPKPNYFPLLPPISPADAKRFCRITGKSYGLPTHHYIPVLLGTHSNDKSKCKITNASKNSSHPHHYHGGLIVNEKKKHVLLKDYRYVFPVLEPENTQQQILRDLLNKKQSSIEQDESQIKFVYTVQERRFSLVFPATLEAAVRDGDVKDVMLSKDSDTVLLRLRQGKNVTVDIKDIQELDELYEGLGPNEQVIKEREQLEAKKRKRKRQGTLSYAKKIFEDKEKKEAEQLLAENYDNNNKHQRTVKKLTIRSIKEEVVDLDVIRDKTSQLITVAETWQDVAKSLDYRNVTDEDMTQGVPIIDQLPIALNVEPKVTYEESTSMISPIVPISENTGSLDILPVIKPLSPLKLIIDSDVQSALQRIPLDELEDTSNANENLMECQILPNIQEITDLVNGIDEIQKSGQEISTIMMNKVKGLKLDIKAAEKFVSGQTIDTPRGSLFVPGQTLITPEGPKFVPGLTVNTPTGPLLIPGQLFNLEDEEKLVFVAGQTLPTDQGDSFFQGQTIGNKFVQGQTIMTEEGPKFVPGQVTSKGEFVPGQTISITDEETRFVPGQTIPNNKGGNIFLPGQSVLIENQWEFVPGQTLESMKFVPGQTLPTPDGEKFVPGQNVVSKSGEIQFVPGITIDDTKFVPGLSMKLSNNEDQFVEGQILRTLKGDKFIPGFTSVTKESFRFAVASRLDEAITTHDIPIGIPINPKTSNIEVPECNEIFGHMVQTEKGIEFIPEYTKKLLKGNRIVPGQLLRNGKEGARFVPGVMGDDGFLPGQIVMTENGEQFVPGQVIDTSGGPKFVPGQIVETRTGGKFVPGQTIITDEGPRFVPGQIVETKAGPTFIPGQVISTEEEGSRFVPGQVVDTPDGPRFVPGRVVESGETGVTFVPGQIVQTEQGPRFVAPDLTDTPEGEFEFSVQGFEVTPEELSLLRPQHLNYNCNSQHQGETSIDARMLRQLSEAGLSLGKQAMTELPTVGIDVDPKAVALEQSLIIAEKLGLHGNSAVKMAQVVSTVAQLAKSIVEQQVHNRYIPEEYKLNGHCEDVKEEWLREAVKAAVASAVLAMGDYESSSSPNEHEDPVYSSISEAFNVLLRKNNISMEESVDRVLHILLVPENRISLCRGALLDVMDARNNKVEILKSLPNVMNQGNEVRQVLDKLSMLLEEQHGTDLIGSAFRTVSKDDPELLTRVLDKVSQDAASVFTEREAADTVHKAIVQAVRESSEIRVKELLNDQGVIVREMLIQAVGLARALGMSTTANSLLTVISDKKSTSALAGDKVTMEVLKRLTVMRKLAEERPQFDLALGQLCSDPELARLDPRLRTLVRESAALMIVPEEAPLKSSVDVPMSLLHAENSFAMEEFLMKRSHKGSAIFMILKEGFQAVVPREAARDVLTGQVAYTVLDEDGIHHFAPLHVFSALRLNRPAAHRFSMYRCPVAKEEEIDPDFTSTTFTGNTNSLASSLDGISYANCNGVTMSQHQQHRFSNGDNTPSFRRLSSVYQENGYVVSRRSSENYIVVKEYTSDVDGFSVNIGDIVEALEHESPTK